MSSGSLTEYNESYHDRSRHCSRISCSVACWTLRNQEQDELIDMDMGAYREVWSLQGLAAIILVIGVVILLVGILLQV
jgi:aldehyde:ferredoxin oxidoreductase